MKYLVFFLIFILVIIVSALTSVLFQDLFFNPPKNNLSEAKLLTKFNKLNTDLNSENELLQSELYRQQEKLSELYDAVKKLNRNSDIPQTGKASVQYSSEELNNLQRQIDELRKKLNLLTEQFKASENQFYQKAAAAIERREAEKRKQQEEAQRKEREKQRQQYSEYLDKIYAKHLDIMEKELGLSTIQSQKVRALLEFRKNTIMQLNYPQQNDSSKNDRSNYRNYRKHWREMQQKYDTEMKQILTPSQYQDYLDKGLNSFRRAQRSLYDDENR